MTTPLPHSTSDTARLMADPPGFAIGWQEPVYIDNPAAGAVPTYTIGGRYWERLVSARFQLVTSAVVANRNPRWTIRDANGQAVNSVRAGFNVPASTTITVHNTVGAADFAADSSGTSYGYLPNLVFPPGWSWRLNVTGIDVGDAITSVILVVQRFPNDATEIVSGE